MAKKTKIYKRKSLKIEKGLFFPEDFVKLPKKTAIFIKKGWIVI